MSINSLSALQTISWTKNGSAQSTIELSVKIHPIVCMCQNTASRWTWKLPLPLPGLKIKHIITALWSCCRTESDAIGSETNALTPRQGLLGKQGIRSLQKKLFCPKYILCRCPENPLLPPGTPRAFSLSASFHLYFPLLHLVKGLLEQILPNTKTPFTVAIWKTTFAAVSLVHFFFFLEAGEGGSCFLHSLVDSLPPTLCARAHQSPVRWDHSRDMSFFNTRL